jgi:hypothetical protein
MCVSSILSSAHAEPCTTHRYVEMKQKTAHHLHIVISLAHVSV